MSSETIAEVAVADQEYGELWCKSTVGVLESLKAAPFTSTCAPVTTASEAAPAGDALELLFKVSGRIEGEQCFSISKSDAVRLAQLLMSEPMDESVAYAPETHNDAVQEIFRQFAGLAATSCKSKYEGEVQFHLESEAPADWKGSASLTGIFASPQVSPIQWTLQIGAELHAVLGVLEAAREAKAAAPPAVESSPSGAEPHAAPSVSPGAAAKTSPAFSFPTPGQPAAAAPIGVTAPVASVPVDSPANLDLLLDIELDASLRFGRREMILRDILALRPGSVVELDRQVQEPAELLIAGRVVARGDVVIVDGSYGLRITEIEQPQQRLISLQT